MEILIFSDSHGRAHLMKNALSRQITPPDAVCFLGDGLGDLEALSLERALLWTVRGNCDFGTHFADEPLVRTVDVHGHRILMTHGHSFFVKSGYGALLSHAAKTGADVVLFGHTHTPVSLTVEKGERIGDVVLERTVSLFNPGSIGEGSFGTLHLTENAVLLSHGTLQSL